MKSHTLTVYNFTLKVCLSPPIGHNFGCLFLKIVKLAFHVLEIALPKEHLSGVLS